MTANKARTDVLEKQVRDSKSQFANKMKVLIDKTENDDKLINILKMEIKKLENSKGITSGLNMNSKGAKHAAAGGFDPEEVVKLH
jgi:hypothetical protein